MVQRDPNAPADDLDCAAALRLAPVALVIVDRQLRCHQITDHFRVLLDLPLEQSAANPHSQWPILTSLISGPMGERLAAHFETCFASAEPVNQIAFAAATARGQPVREWQFSCQPVMSPAGDVVGASGVVVDVTASVQTARELAASERRFRGTFEDAAIGIAHVGLDGKFLRVNDRLCNLLGYSRDELICLTFQDITHPDDLDYDLQLVDEVLRGERPNYSLEKRYRHQRGHDVWNNLTVSLLRTTTGAPDYFIAFIEDISARKTVEHDLLVSEERLARIAESSTAVFWMTQHSPEQVLYVSPAFEKVWGRAAADIYADPRLWVQTIHPDDRERIRRTFEHWLVAPLERTYSVEYRVVRPDESLVWIADKGSVILTPDGRLDRIMGVAHDITASKLDALRIASSEHQLRTFLDSAPTAMGLVQVPPDNSDILHVVDNAATEKFFHVPRGALANRWAHRELGVARDTLELWLENYRTAQRTGAPTQFLAPYHLPVPGKPDETEVRWLAVTVAYVGPGDEQRDLFCYVSLDDTRRIRAEEQLQRHHDTFMNLVENAPFGLYVIDSQFRFDRISRGAKAVFSAFDPIVGRDLADVMRVLWAEPFANHVIERFRHTLDTGEPYESTESTEQRGNIDSIESYHWQLERITMPNGKFGVACYFYETTRLKRAETALRQHEQRQSLLLELLHTVRATSDEDEMWRAAATALGTFLKVHRVGFVNVLDGERLQFGASWTDGSLPPLTGDLVTPNIRGTYLQYARTGHTVAVADVTLDPRTADSGFAELGVRAIIGAPIMRSGRWVASMYVHHRTPHAWTDDDVALVRKVADQTWDAVERTRFVQALELSEGQLRMATELANVGVITSDYLANNMTFDDVAGKLYDLPSRQPLDREQVHARIHPEDYARFMDHLGSVLSQASPGTLSTSYRVVHTSGEVRWLSICKRVYFEDIAGEHCATHAVIAAADVTEHRMHEATLEAARLQAEAANRARGEFLANMSHEIRTPMTAILGYADLLASNLHNEDDIQYVNTIRRNGRFLVEIINDILDLSKIDAGKVEIDNQRIAPEVVVADAVSLMNVRAEEKRLDLQVDFTGPLPKRIETDVKRLRQILLNLLGNAIKFTDRGSVRLSVNYNAAENRIEFTISDTGIGMAEEFLGRLFDPFTQADASVTRTFGGTGLGLAISRRLALMLGGDIRAASQLGQGSQFTLSISPGPVANTEFVQPSILTTTPDAPPAATQLHGHYLIVDDRHEIRFLAQRFISQAGGETAVASNGLEALTAVEEALTAGRPFHAILMDMQMPIMDGFAAVSELRRRGVEIPIIALTANAMDGDADACLDAGCDAFIAKPIDRQLLIQTLDELT